MHGLMILVDKHTSTNITHKKSDDTPKKRHSTECLFDYNHNVRRTIHATCCNSWSKARIHENAVFNSLKKALKRAFLLLKTCFMQLQCLVAKFDDVVFAHKFTDSKTDTCGDNEQAKDYAKTKFPIFDDSH